jgi:NAD(P)-dependent dehydrogenase (short-subunit alcohol dehydrogenase family)
LKGKTMSKVWFITGSAGGLGAAIAKAALVAGDRVVATDRDVVAVTETFRQYPDKLLALYAAVEKSLANRRLGIPIKRRNMLECPYC